MAIIIVEVCAGTHCVMMGSMNIIDSIHSLEELGADSVNACELQVRAIPCMNLCKDQSHGPFVKVDGQLIQQAESESVMAAIMERSQRGREQP